MPFSEARLSGGRGASLGDADLSLQKKILTVIEDGRFYRLGGTTPIQSKFKVIFASHRNLKKMVEEGTFREDLYMRISTLKIQVPPFSERKQDIPDIVAAMLPRICEMARVKVDFLDLPQDFVQYLIDTPFRGNGRGIFQQVARLLAVAPTDRKQKKALANWRRLLEVDSSPVLRTGDSKSISLSDLNHSPFNIIGHDFPGRDDVMATFERRLYREARDKFKTNNAIARVLKISQSTASLNLKRFEQTPVRVENPETKQKSARFAISFVERFTFFAKPIKYCSTPRPTLSNPRLLSRPEKTEFGTYSSF